MRRSRSARRLLILLATCVSFLGRAQGQQIHRNGFEGREPVWIKGSADGNSHEILHETTDLTARTGQRCEHIKIDADYVRKMLAEIVKDQDLSRYIL